MSDTDRVFALIAAVVVVAFTVGLWMTNLLWVRQLRKKPCGGPKLGRRACALASVAAQSCRDATLTGPEYCL